MADYLEYFNIGIPFIFLCLWKLDRRLVKIETTLSFLTGKDCSDKEHCELEDKRPPETPLIY
jgi:hypothetical protein